ncbi:MAG: hypothetical protein KZQ94_01015 [Candidatus Thiodiazotropha sp. (ex Troendleina suluensis)]|nr:hypothetical protein [Candidatus Thiodiazotropha sp. (ex Troendleina suluensis)]
MCRIITQAELHHLSSDQLRALLGEVTRQLHSTAPGTKERQTALASLKNIQMAMAQRLAAPRPKPPGF